MASFCLLAACMFGAEAQDAKPLKGVALVIGNSDYEHLAKLPNPAHDARAIEEMLNGLGFDTTVVSDRNARRLKRDLEGFVEDAEGADVAVLYYSGHGIEAGGENYLVPVSADLSALDAAGEELVPVRAVIDELKASAAVTIVLLDACRNNPFPADAVLKVAPDSPGAPLGAVGSQASRGADPLGQTSGQDETFGTVIGFAAEPGKVALDGPAGGNSPYAAAILRHLTALQGEEFGTVMRMVSEEVYLKTSGRQRPWVNENLRRLLYFGGSPQQPAGEDGAILGERRQLLLTIAALPEPGRKQIEALALADGVPMDALYGMLKALGAEAPKDPEELDRLLRGQTERLKAMLAEREAIKTADPEISRLTALADRALREGALTTAIKALDDAKARVGSVRSAVDQAEVDLIAKKREFAAVYARSAEANALAWEQLKAAADYRSAYDEIARWDEALAWAYKQKEAEVLQAYGERKADNTALFEALDAGNMALKIADGLKDQAKWAASTRQNGLIQYTLGTRESGAARLEIAAELARQTLQVWDPDKQADAWAEAQNNIGNALWAIGEREVASTRLVEAEGAYRAALAKVSRERSPLFWAQIQNNIGNVAAALGLREVSVARLQESVAAYDAALEVMTFEATPAYYGLIQKNRGKALSTRGQIETGTQSLEKSLTAFDLALKGAPRELFPLTWALIHMNAGIALETLAQRDDDPDGAAATREQALAAFDGALQELTRANAPLQRALTLHNSALTLQGQARAEADKIARMQRLDLARSRQVEARGMLEQHQEPAIRSRMNVNLAQTLDLLAFETDVPAERKALFEQEAQNYRDASSFVTPDLALELWAQYQAALGRALQLAAELEDGQPRADHALEAVGVQRALADRLAEGNQTALQADALHDLGYSYIILAGVEGIDAYRRAEAAYREEMIFRSREQGAVAWAKVQAGLGNALRGIGLASGERATLLEARQRTEEARAAIQPYDTSYNGVLDQRLTEIDAKLAELD